MVKQIRKSQRSSRQKELAVVMALVNGLNSAAPLVLPLAAIDAGAPAARCDETGRELANSFNRGGQLLDRLFFSTAYAGYGDGETIGTGESVTTKNVENSTADGDIINSGGVQNVRTSGSATNTTINSSGTQQVSSSGSASDTTINGGYQQVNSGGSATNTIINNGGGRDANQAVNGGTVTSTTIVSGTQRVNSGTATNTIIHSSGKQDVYGGSASFTSVSGGRQNVNSGGSATNTVIYSGQQVVSNGGTVTQTGISGGTQQVDYGGSAITTLIYNGGTQLVDGTATTAAIHGGTQEVRAGGTATDTRIFSGTQNVNVNGSATSTTINDGTQNVNSGGTANDTVIHGGTQNVKSGGTATNTVIQTGGEQHVFHGGTASNLNVYGTQTVYGATNGSMIMTGGTQTVYTGGTAANGSIQSGGRQHISGGSVTGATISGGGKQDVYAGGSASNTTINGTISVSGEQHVRGSDTASGSAANTIINQYGYQKVHAYGIASGTTINDGGRQNVFGDGTASGTTINSNGRQNMNSGGSATSTTINGGGWQIVSAGGSVSGTIINGLTPTGAPPVLGTQELYGTDNGAVINNGGQQLVENGSIATGAIVNSGGQQVVNAGGDVADIGGIANGTTINSGGKQIAYGGIVSGTIINGGEQEVGVHAKANGTIVNTGSQQIVSSGGTASGTVVNANGFQVVKSSGTASGTTINHFGNQTVSAGGNVTGAAVYGEQILYGGTVSGTSIHSGGSQFVWNSAIVTDEVIDGGEVILGNNGAALGGSTILKSGSIQAGLFNNVSYTIDDLTVTGGQIILTNITLPQNTKTADRKLTIGKLTGAANFVIATDLAKGDADHITITSGSPAQHTLQVAYDPLYETGGVIDGVSVDFANVPDSGTGFTAITTDHGAYRYTPTLAASEDGTTWYVTGLGLSDPGPDPDPGPGASETGYTASDAATGSLMLWRQENNSLTRRMGELRSNPGQSGDWVRVYKGEQEIATVGNRSITQRYTAIQGGHDSTADFWGRTWRAGYTVGYLDADISLARGSGDASSLSVGGYAAWLGDKGHFLDLIVKQGRLKTSYDSYLNDPGNTKVSGSYRNWGTSFSAEYGYRQQLAGNWYLEPQAELTLGRIGSASYTASDGTAVHHRGLNSVTGRLGLAAGRTTDNGTFYAKASLVKEFNANARATMASGGHAPVILEQSLKENWLELAVGVTGALNDKTDGYLEVSRTTGDKVKTPWQVNLGARWNF